MDVSELQWQIMVNSFHHISDTSECMNDILKLSHLTNWGLVTYTCASELISGLVNGLFSIKPLSEQMVTYHSLGPRNKNKWNFNKLILFQKYPFENIVCKLEVILLMLLWLQKIWSGWKDEHTCPICYLVAIVKTLPIAYNEAWTMWTPICRLYFLRCIFVYRIFIYFCTYFTDFCS